MLTFIFNSIFFVGKLIGYVGHRVQDLSIYLHIKFKTETGVRIDAALKSAKEMVAQMKQQPKQIQGVNKNEQFRSFFVGRKPGNS